MAITIGVVGIPLSLFYRGENRNTVSGIPVSKATWKLVVAAAFEHSAFGLEQHALLP